jgi:SdrD B-like domain
MSRPSPPRIEPLALAALLLLLLAIPAALRAEMTSGEIEWSINTPLISVAPKSFPTIAVHLRNSTAAPVTRRLHFKLGMLRSLNGDDLDLSVPANEERTILYTVYVPPEAIGGSEIKVIAQAEDGTTRETQVRIDSVLNYKATTDSTATRFLRPGEKTSYNLTITNAGNVPLHCAIHPTTSPTTALTNVMPENLFVPVGESAGAVIEVQTSDSVTEFTSFVTSTEINAAEMNGEAARQFLYFHTEAFPLPAGPDSTHLFEILKGSLLAGAGSGIGNHGKRRGGDELVHEELTIEGLIAERTRLQFSQASTYPSLDNGRQSSALSSLPETSSRNYFHLGLYNPYFDLEGGEITTAPPRLLSSREIGDGARVAVRPTGNEELQLEAFAERNTLTITRKDVFGTMLSGTLQNSPLEWWRVGTLSKRGDIGPQGRDWDTVGVDTGWKVPLPIPLRAEFSLGAGENNEGQDGVAWLAGLHYNRTQHGEKDDSPLKAGVEFASGDKGFPGAQNGRDDQRAYVTFRLSANPTYVEAFADYNNSQYKVVPNIEKTLAEEQDILPDFLLTSQSRLIDAGLRWNASGTSPGVWHFPSGNVQFQETRYFTKSDFFDRSEERAIALNLQPFKQPAISGGTDWTLNLFARGGEETHESDNAPKTDSPFITIGADFNVSGAAPGFLEKIGGPGRINAEFSGRYTDNLHGDKQALNRTGISITTVTSWQTDSWSARAGATLYSYVDQGLADRIWANVSRRVGKGWWAGIEAAYTHRSDGNARSDRREETAVLFTIRHDFEIAVPWLPRKGQAAGVVFDDLNNNGRQDPGEPGLEGVKVMLGPNQALSGPKGEFSFPPISDGTYPVAVTPPEEVHFNESADHPIDKTVLNKGAITPLALGLTKLTTCEGNVRLVREYSEADPTSTEHPVDLSGIEIIVTDSAGRTQRSPARADGFFAVYLEPGTYEIQVNPATLKPQQSVSPGKLTVKVEHARIENLVFVVTERPKHIRKTFTAKNL